MSRRKIPSKQALIDALHECRGNMAAVGRRFNVARQRVSELVRADPKLQEIVEEETEAFIDIAEQLLYKHIVEGNIVATIFFLKTRARHRGYSEKFEITAISQHQIEVDLGTGRENDQAQAIDSDVTAIALLEQ